MDNLTAAGQIGSGLFDEMIFEFECMSNFATGSLCKRMLRFKRENLENLDCFVFSVN